MIMDKWICDDREDTSEVREKICSMSDEEFEKYLLEIKKEEKDTTSQ